MSIEELEVIDFLHSYAPLDNLPLEVSVQLAKVAETAYRRAGTIILSAGEPNHEVFLIRKGSVTMKDLSGQITAQLDSGNWFGFSALLQQGIMHLTVESSEDCLLFVFPDTAVQKIMHDYEGVKNYFSTQKSNRLQHAVLNYRGDSQTQLISSQIEDIKRRTSLAVSSDTAIAEAAKLMAAEKRSALLVIDAQEFRGIVTESDFCRKVVAQGLDTQLPIDSVMTANPVVVSGTVSASEALLTMAKHHIHHLPFLRQNGEFSTITASDLIQFQSHNPLFLITDIYGSLSVEELKQHSQKIPELLTDLVNSGLAAYDIGNLISSVSEAINQRLLQLAEKQLGKPPIAYGWIVAGSLGRMEQTAHSDQDNALIFADAYDPELHKEYFSALASFVCDGLAACGYVYCPGNIMATNSQWQMTASQWRDAYLSWINKPEPEALLNSVVFFDARVIYGEATLLDEVLAEVLQNTGDKAPFIAHVATNALQFSPPLGLFRNFVLETGGAEAKALNLKTRGVAPVTDYARTYALLGGIEDLNTRDRLIAAAAQGFISEQGKSDLIDAYAFICDVRLEHQCRQIEAGQKPDNFVSPEMLSSLERQHLKDAFDVVNTLQKHMRQRF